MIGTKVSHRTAKSFSDQIQKELKQGLKDGLYSAQQALNNTAFKARENLFYAYRGIFNVHNKNFFTTNLRKGVKVIKADRKKDGLDMSVDIYFPYDWFRIHAFGGIKTPQDTKKGGIHNMLAIPTSHGSVKINYSGRISGAGATRMLKYYNEHPKKTKGRVANPHAFIMKGVANGKDVIAKRQKAVRKEIDWYFVLQPQLKVKKNWDFYGIIQITFKRHLNEEFEKALQWCIDHPKV